MSHEKTRDRYLEPYRQSHRRHGSAFEVTLWASPQSQRLRFEVFSQMGFLAGKRILDAGCSRGDFAAFLVEQEIPFKHYVGIDALCEVVEFAQQRDLPNCEFQCGDFVTNPAILAHARADVVCISGTLNTMDDAHVLAVLEAAWTASRQMLLFNFLSDLAGPGAPPQDDYARRLDALELIAWATAKTPYVAFRQDYFKEGHDATILMRKAPQ